MSFRGCSGVWSDTGDNDGTRLGIPLNGFLYRGTVTEASAGRTLSFDWETTKHSVPEDILGMITGTFVASLGLFLLDRAGAVTGGTAGLSLLLSHAMAAVPFWVLFLAINLPFAVLAVVKKSVRFAVLTGIAIAVVSGWSVVHENLVHISQLNPVYAVLGGNLLAGVGLLILFRHSATLGGVNIVAILIQEKTGFRAGWTQMIFDVLIVASSLFVVEWPLVLLSAAGAVVLNLVIAMNHRPGRYIGH